MTIITRRNVLQGLIAAPAIIAIERLMKPKLWVPEKKVMMPGWWAVYNHHTAETGLYFDGKLVESRSEQTIDWIPMDHTYVQPVNAGWASVFMADNRAIRYRDE